MKRDGDLVPWQRRRPHRGRYAATSPLPPPTWSFWLCVAPMVQGRAVCSVTWLARWRAPARSASLSLQLAILSGLGRTSGLYCSCIRYSGKWRRGDSCDVSCAARRVNVRAAEGVICLADIAWRPRKHKLLAYLVTFRPVRLLSGGVGARLSASGKNSGQP